MEHFTWSGVTTLCVTRTKLADEMKLLSKNQVDMLRALPSFRKLVNYSSPCSRGVLCYVSPFLLVI